MASPTDDEGPWTQFQTPPEDQPAPAGAPQEGAGEAVSTPDQERMSLGGPRGPWEQYQTPQPPQGGEVGPGPNTPPPEQWGYPLPRKYVDAVKQSEGDPNSPKFYQASWDVRQNTVGWGTRARYAGEKIDLPEAQRRFDAEFFGKHYPAVDEFAPNAPIGIKAALTSLDYNSGSKWMRENLGRAIQAGDYDRARRLFLSYNHSGGMFNSGVAARRLREAQWWNDKDEDQDWNAPASKVVIRQPTLAPTSGPVARRAPLPGRPAPAVTQTTPFNPWDNRSNLGVAPPPEDEEDEESEEAQVQPASYQPAAQAPAPGAKVPSIDEILAAPPEQRQALMAGHIAEMAKGMGIDLPTKKPNLAAPTGEAEGPWTQYAQAPEAEGPWTQYGKPSGSPKADTQSGVFGVALEAGRRGLYDAITSSGQALDPFKDRAGDAFPKDDQVGKLLAQPFSQGWSSPSWWAAQISHGMTSSSPMWAGTVVGGYLGAMTPIPGGTVIGAAGGGAIGSAIQTVAPAYQKARAEGLDHDAAVDRAIKETGIGAAFGAAMGVAPPVVAQYIKGPISSALATIFGVMPALGAAQGKATAALEGKDYTLDDLFTGYAQMVGMGVAGVGAHQAFNAATGRPTMFTPPPEGGRGGAGGPGPTGPTGPDPYDVLGLKPDASAADIKAAFRARARETHPDAGGSAEDFDQVVQAYRTLNDPDRRAAYDASGARPPPPSSSWVDSFKRWFGMGAKGAPPAEPRPAAAAGTLASDMPSAEPVGDLMAQARDLADPKNPRQAVWLPRASLDAISPDDKKTWSALSTGVQVSNFDGSGGMLVAKDQATADAAIRARDAGKPLQEILGGLTGAGKGKPAEGTHVVQQVDKDGAVTRESLVTEAELEKTKKDLAAPDRDVRVVSPQEALQRRATAQQTPPTASPIIPVVAPQVQPAQPPQTFQTALGSTYQVHDDGTTTRNKAARDEPGHEGQQGIQPRSEKTYYIDPKYGQRLALPEGRSVIVDHRNDTVSVASLNTGGPNAGQWGISPESRAIPVTTKPEVGKVPIELWGKGQIPGKTQQHEAYQRIHLGNKITSVGGGAGGPPATLEPTAEAPAHGERPQGSVKVQGISVAIETRKGEIRKGKGWQVKMPADYGYIEGEHVPARSRDKEHVDAYVGDHRDSDRAFIVNQHDPASGNFDEAKIILGTRNLAEATKLYDGGFSDKSGPKRRHSIIEMSIPELKDVLIYHDFKTPVHEHSAERAKGRRIHDIIDAWKFMRGVQERLKLGPDKRPSDQAIEGANYIAERLRELDIPTDPEAPVPSAAALRKYLTSPGFESRETAGHDQGGAPEAVQGEGEGRRGQAVHAEPEAQPAEHEGTRAAEAGEGRRPATGRPERQPERRQPGAAGGEPTTRPEPGSEHRPAGGGAVTAAAGEPATAVQGGAEPAGAGLGLPASRPAAEHADRGVEKRTFDEDETNLIVDLWRHLKASNPLNEVERDLALDTREHLYLYGIDPEQFPTEGALRSHLTGEDHEKAVHAAGQAAPVPVAGGKTAEAGEARPAAEHRPAENAHEREPGHPERHEGPDLEHGRPNEPEPAQQKPAVEKAPETGPSASGKWWQPGEKSGGTPVERIGKLLHDAGYGEQDGMQALIDAVKAEGEYKAPDRQGGKTYLDWYEEAHKKVPASVLLHLALEIEKAAKEDQSTRAMAERLAPQTPIDAIRHRLLYYGEGGFRNIREARALAREHGFEGTDKQIDELVEQAVVEAARISVEALKDEPPAEVFSDLVDLYKRQPNLAARTSTSVSNQAYSTPVPLAYLASRLAGVAGAKSVYDPAAGNGALLIEADPQRQHVIANEINQGRSDFLGRQGFEDPTEDATKITPEVLKEITTLKGPVDVVIANPPFGAVREKRKSKSWDIDGFKTSQIDHAIALRALEHLPEKGGKAVLILGSVKADSEEERRKGYRGEAKRLFYKHLYDNYNVVDHFTVSGDLYKKQGAGWPVDVVVIRGRANLEMPTSMRARPLPAANPPPILKTWDALAEKLPHEGQHGLEAGAAERPAERAPEAGPGPAGDHAPAVEKAAGGRPERALPEAGGEPAGVRGNRAPREPANVGPGGDHGVAEPEGARVAGRADQQAAPQPLRPRVKREPEQEGKGQVPYEPTSSAEPLDTLVPTNMAAASHAAMERVQERHGSVDAFVADRLGYDKKSAIGNYFSAEQVDALASAIDNLERGDAFILGDQTGIGKGRVVAGVLRYAMQRGDIPVFITEKPDLYGDMIRDMTDIGLPDMLGREPRILMTNAGETVPLDEEALAWKQEADTAKQRAKDMGEKNPILPKRRGKFLSGGTVQKVKKGMEAVTQGGADKPDVIFSTYDQMQGKPSMDRRAFLRQIASRSLIVFDESHNAGGAGKKGWEAKGKMMNRADFAREIAKDAKGVLFSSATYAKRPDVMDLYARTDMGKAVDDPKDLPELIQRGGLPMQQVVAGMLANSGQYMRRERSFHGVEYAVKGVPVDEKAYKQFSDAMRAIFQFDLAMSAGGDKSVRKRFMEDILDARGMAKSKDTGVGEAGAHTIAFGSVMHNIVNQMLLAIKADQTAKAAIEAHKAGEKPVIALANTNEAFLRDFANQEGIKIGDEMAVDFGDVLLRYLSRTLRVTIKHDKETREHVQIPVSDLPVSLQQAYKTAENRIKAGNYESLPISPIDYIRQKLRDAGMSVAEVTGRQTMLDYSGDTPKFVARPKSEMGSAGKRGSIAAFNRGSLDAIVLNRSGATGVSMHASDKFKDQRRRRMILAQPETNIDTHLQMLGRVHRTGQVIPPAYSQLAAEIPAEARPTAVLMKKMASLNANTTGARSSVFTADSTDFMNEVGDKVVRDALIEDPELNRELGDPLGLGKKETPELDDLSRKATGRLTLLDTAVQQEFLDRVTKAYHDEIKQLDDLGENPLEAKTLDLQAKRIGEPQVLKPKQGDSPFLDEVRLEKVSAKAQGRAMSPAEVATAVREFLKVPQGHAITTLPADRDLATVLSNKGKEWLNGEIDRITEHARGLIRDEVAKTSDDAKESTRQRLEGQLDRWRSTMKMLAPGSVVKLGLPAGDMHAVVLSVERTGKAKSMMAPSAWRVKFAVPDSARMFDFPLSKLFPPGIEKEEGEKGASLEWPQMRHEELMPEFEKARIEGREERHIITGNILAGYEQSRGTGRIVNYTTEDGKLHPGILMSREFKSKEFMERRAVRMKSGDEVATFLDKAEGLPTVTTTDGNATLSKNYRDQYVIETPAARARGGLYYTDPDVRMAIEPAEFRKHGSRMRVELDRPQFVKALDAMRAGGALFETTEAQDVATQIVGEHAPPAEAARPPASKPAAEAEVPKGPQGPFVMGKQEWVSLPDLGLPGIKTRIDTGAKTSSLHAFGIEKNGDQVTFSTQPEEGSKKTVRVTAKMIGETEVKSSNGKKEMRPIIETMMRMGTREWPIKVTLTNRSTMGHRMLLGREAMQKDMLVNPNERFLQGGREEKAIEAAIGGGAFDEASEENWLERGQQGYLREQAIEHAETPRAPVKAVPRSALELEADQLTQKVRDYEKSLNGTPEQIAAAIEKKFGFPVDADALKRGEVWWKPQKIIRNPTGIGGYEKFWTEPRLAELQRLWTLPMTNAERAVHMSDVTGRPITKAGIDMVVNRERARFPDHREQIWEAAREMHALLSDPELADLPSKQAAQLLTNALGREISSVAVDKARYKMGLGRGREGPKLWDDALKAELKRLVDAGKMTSAKMAEHLSAMSGKKVTKSSVDNQRFKMRNEAPEAALGAPSEPEPPKPIVNDDGFVRRLPYQEKWGDPRSDPEARENALARLRDIQMMPVKTAPWADLVEARNDIKEITANLWYYKPDLSIEDIRQFADSDIFRYVHLRDRTEEQDSKWPVFFRDELTNPNSFDLKEFQQQGRQAINHILDSHRAGVKDLMLWGEKSEEPTTRGPRVNPAKIGETLPSGFYFRAGRLLKDVPEGLFKQSGQAVIDWLRKNGVSRAEINHFQLQEKFGDVAKQMGGAYERRVATREEFAKAIAQRMFDFNRRISWLNPERSTNDYGETETGRDVVRAFRGPRIPGRGVYFEEPHAFPRKLRGGAPLAAGHFKAPHWEGILPGTWASTRGSVRELPGWGKTLVIEESQTDLQQGANARRTPEGTMREPRRPRIPEKEYLKLLGERELYQSVKRRAQWAVDAMNRAASRLDPNWRRDFDLRGGTPEEWEQRFNAAREAMRNAYYGGGALDAYRQQALSDGIIALEDVKRLRNTNRQYFEPDAYRKYESTESFFTPTTPVDASYVRTMIRTGLIRAAREKADAIALSTSDTNDRIQMNTYSSAAHFYDQQLKPRLERELRRLTGDGSLKVEKIFLPKAMGAPRNERPYTVWAARLSPEVRAKILAEGEPMMAIKPGEADNSHQAALLRTRRLIGEKLERGETVHISDRIARAVFDAARSELAMIPGGARSVYALTKVEPLGVGDAVEATFRNEAGEIQQLRYPWKEIIGARSLHVGGNIFVPRYSLLDAFIFRRQFLGNIVAELGHEVVHALKALGAFDQEIWNRLLLHGASLNLLGGNYNDYLRITGSSYAGRMDPNLTVRDAYRVYYGSFEVFQALPQEQRDALVRDKLRDETVTHMMEWWRRGLLSDADVAPVLDILQAIRSGEMAQRVTRQPDPGLPPEPAIGPPGGGWFNRDPNWWREHYEPGLVERLIDRIKAKYLQHTRPLDDVSQETATSFLSNLNPAKNTIIKGVAKASQPDFYPARAIAAIENARDGYFDAMKVTGEVLDQGARLLNNYGVPAFRLGAQGQENAGWSRGTLAKDLREFAAGLPGPMVARDKAIRLAQQIDELHGLQDQFRAQIAEAKAHLQNQVNEYWGEEGRGIPAMPPIANERGTPLDRKILERWVQEADDTLASAIPSPAPLQGVHYTTKDFDRFISMPRRDSGYWGRGIYMFPYDYARGWGLTHELGTYYGIRDETGTRGIPVHVHSEKPFYIDEGERPKPPDPTVGGIIHPPEMKGDYASLEAHGWPYGVPPVRAWHDQAILDRTDNSQELAEAKVAEAKARALSKQYFDLEDAGTVGADELKAAEKVLMDAQEEREIASRKATKSAVLSQQFTDALLKAGYDSVVLRDKKGEPYEMVAIKPGTVTGMHTGEVMFSASSRGVAPISDHAKAIEDAREIVRRIAGHDVDIVFRPQIGVGKELRPAVEAQASALGQEPQQTVGGLYRPAKNLDGKALIGLATNDARYSLRTTAGHEAWHHVEETMATPPERKLLNSEAEMSRMRRMAAAEVGLEPDDPRLQNLDPREIRALAFQRYRREREDNGNPSGLHIGIRRLWDRILSMFRTIRNAFSRRKVEPSSLDIFEQARTGEMAQRQPQTRADRVTAAYDQVLGEVRRGERRPGQPGPLTKPETLASSTPPPRWTPGTPPPPPPPPLQGRGKLSAAWANNVQPELWSDHALRSEQRFRRYKSAVQMLKDGPYKRFESMLMEWAKQPDSERIRFMDRFERHYTSVMADWQKPHAALFKELLDAAHAMEQAYGSTAAYVEGYLSHIWAEDPDKVRTFFMNYVNSLGPTWFMKPRSFQFITQGLAAGFKLKYTNPAELVLHRLFASADMIERVKLLRDLHEQLGVAMPAKGNDRYLAQGWQPINAPDRQRWLLAPDIQPMWKNAVQAKGLWDAEGLTGDVFRKWMTFKNAWVPVKLTLSGFHPLHVLGINVAQDLRRAGAQALRGDIPGALESAASSVWGPIAAAIPGVPHLGKAGMAAWLKPADQRTPIEQFVVDRMNAGGFVPQMTEEQRQRAKIALAEAWTRQDWWRIAPNAFRRTMEKFLQGPIFEHWIPALKTAAYLHEAEAYFKANPDKLTDPIQYGTALSTIAKQVDNEFGEMFYGGLFWNRTLKDVGIGSFLSLGWNLGFARGFVGGAFEPMGRAWQYARGRRPSETRQTIRSASTKTSNALVYMALSMLIAGMMTKALSGENPSEWRDYFFPRIGGKNPDGTPRRVTTMFFTREIPMLAKHIEDKGGGIEGAVYGTADMIWNKMLFQPFIDVFRNKNYYGADIRDPDAGVLTQVGQFLKHIGEDQALPITVTSSFRALETGGEPSKEIPLALMGFGPAPMYAARSGLENRINAIYREYVKPERTAHDEAEIANQKRTARMKLQVAIQRGDKDAERQARQELGALHGKIYNTPYAVYQFSHRNFPPSKQLHLLNEMSPDELKTYFPKARPAVKQKFRETHPSGAFH